MQTPETDRGAHRSSEIGNRDCGEDEHARSPDKWEKHVSHGLYKRTEASREEMGLPRGQGNNLVLQKIHSVEKANEFFVPCCVRTGTIVGFLPHTSCPRYQVSNKELCCGHR